MDKLKCCIKTLTSSEVSHFKSYLRKNAKKSKSKKELLFKLLVQGKLDNERIKRKLYNNKEDNPNAFYQLRKGLFNDLENFLVLEQIKNESYAQMCRFLSLAYRAKFNGHSVLASYYFSKVVSDAGELGVSGLKKTAQEALLLIDEKVFYELTKNYVKDLTAISSLELIECYPLSFFTSLRSNWYHKVGEILIENAKETNKLKSYLDLKKRFMLAYAYYNIKQYPKAMNVINELNHHFNMSTKGSKSIQVWIALLKGFVFVETNQTTKAMDQFSKLKEDFFDHIGSHYQLIVLRWILVVHLKHNTTSKTLNTIETIIEKFEDYVSMISKIQVTKFMAFAVGFAIQNNKVELLNRLKQINNHVKIPNWSSAEMDDPDKRLHDFYAINGLNDIKKDPYLKTPEDLYIQKYWSIK